MKTITYQRGKPFTWGEVPMNHGIHGALGLLWRWWRASQILQQRRWAKVGGLLARMGEEGRGEMGGAMIWLVLPGLKFISKKSDRALPHQFWSGCCACLKTAVCSLQSVVAGMGVYNPI
jgi:hypothetical protein